jgi:hypothetical protein
VSDANQIARIEIDESDGNAIFPDCNIGYDTFRVATLGGPGTTTTTTIPGGCGSTVTLAQLNCRLAALRARLGEVDVGMLASKLRSQLEKATAKKEQAEVKCASGDTKRARNALKKSERKLTGFSHTIRSLKGRRTITDPALREELTTAADGTRTDMKALRGGAICT